jgi:hypothetical protein
MSEQARKVKNKNIPQWAQGLYYSSGLMSEVLVYHDEEIEGLKIIEEEESAHSQE